ncbi:MAG: GNAT family N-acetyltransferase [Atribacterota bacterium]|jgi:GNAT superfamily N-acetyltransferase|nr:GNAT family N-acetyltransferase [Atribacterota bacterium]MDD3641744.1 GNAT family N-acetyltransferase [Atribacterota bacterium]
MDNNNINFKIRSAEEKDIQTLARFRLSLQEHMEYLNSGILSLSQGARKSLPNRYRQWIVDPMRSVICAELESGELAGMAVALVIEQTDWSPPRVGRIDDVWVEKKYRRKGVTRQLIKHLLNFFSRHHVSTIALDFLSGNEEAESTWKSFGFKTILKTAIISSTELERRIGKTLKES